MTSISEKRHPTGDQPDEDGNLVPTALGADAGVDGSIIRVGRGAKR